MNAMLDGEAKLAETTITRQDLDRFLAHATRAFGEGPHASHASDLLLPEQARILAGEIGLRLSQDGTDLELLSQAVARVLAGHHGKHPTAAPAPAVRRANVPFGALWKEFERDQIALHRWQPAIARQNRISANLFMSICGDKPLSSYVPADGTKFRRVLLALPRDYSKNPQYRAIYTNDGPIAVTVAAEDRPNIKRLSPVTCNRHFAAFAGFWDFAKRESCVPPDKPSIFEGLAIRHRAAALERPIWSDTFVKAVFSAPLFYGCGGRHAWRKSGPSVLRDERYWGILMGPHQGLRREELFQLKVGNVRRDVDTGIWYFDLHAPNVTLKNVGSARCVPLHANILRLGFIEARVQGRPADAFLFPEAVPSAADGKRGDHFGKFFSFFRRDIVDRLHQRNEIDDDEAARCEHMVYHSARHTVATLLYRAGAPIAHCEELLGHESRERRSEFSRYNKGMALRELKLLVDRIVLPLDVDAHLAAVRRSEELDRTTVWPPLDRPISIPGAR